ncbi:hypothetical protein [Vibrio gazogenes]|uniref:Uncharacterized protein n=1 Tax=Vibrio gazogenes TaxID=687 RepID=A0A1Z2SFW8_VIBGA|nr:hypothetical protein [Vibrio gazogenes]ASA56066.1 hypothetical protein BSQ33_10405 [Vibrio gazogenes]
MRKKLSALLILCAASAFSVNATETLITGKVTVVEATYMPGSISFQMNVGTSLCPAGKWLQWRKNEENNKVVYSTLMTALVSGKKINFYLVDGDSGCHGSFIHLLSS